MRESAQDRVLPEETKGPLLCCYKKKQKKNVKTGGTRLNDVSPETIKSRLKEHPHEPFEIHGETGKILWCKCCNHEVASGKADCTSHTRTEKHKANATKYAAKDARKLSTGMLIMNSTKAAEAALLSTAAPGSIAGTKGMITVGLDEQVHRYEVVKAFILSGTPAKKMDFTHLKEKLEAGGTIGKSSDMLRRYLQPCLDEEMEIIKKETEVRGIREDTREETRGLRHVGNNLPLNNKPPTTAVKGRPIGVYYDGTTQDGEAFVIVIRFVDAELRVKTYVLEIKWYAQSMNHTHIAASIVTAIMQTLGHEPALVAALMHDRCAANGCSFRQHTSAIFVGADDEDCYPHTGTHAAEHLDTPTLDEFLAITIGMFADSNIARGHFRALTGKTYKKKSGTRWWATIDVVCQQREAIEAGFMMSLADYLIENKNCIKSAPKLKAILGDERKVIKKLTFPCFLNSSLNPSSGIPAHAQPRLCCRR